MCSSLKSLVIVWVTLVPKHSIPDSIDFTATTLRCCIYSSFFRQLSHLIFMSLCYDYRFLFLNFGPLNIVQFKEILIDIEALSLPNKLTIHLTNLASKRLAKCLCSKTYSQEFNFGTVFVCISQEIIDFV